MRSGEMFDISRKKAFVCDLDGTLFMGPNPIRPAVDFVIKSTLNRRFSFLYLTNNTSKCPEEYMKKIAGAAIPVVPEQILTPLITLESYIREKGYRSVYLLASAKVTAHLEAQLAGTGVRFGYEPEDATGKPGIVSLRNRQRIPHLELGGRNGAPLDVCEIGRASCRERV